MQITIYIYWYINHIVMKDTDGNGKSQIKSSKTSITTTTELNSTRDNSLSIPNRKFEELEIKIETLTK